jgi:tight adherence protein C
VIAAAAAGALVGLGAFLVVRGLVPARPPLSAVLARVGAGSEPVAPVVSSSRWAARVGPAAVRVLERLNLPVGHLGPDLAILGRSVEDHLAARVAGAALGIAGAAGLGLLAASAGLAPAPAALGWVTVAAAGVGFVVPDALARRRAAVRRAGFRQALAFYFDLVVVVLAGGAGVTSALAQAAEAGDGWAFRQLRAALAAGRVRREPPWAVLGRLGVELGVGELDELASAVALAEREGASVRQSLAAKAASIRDTHLAAAQAQASAATVRMAAPLVLLGLSFCAFILYGAVSSAFFR